MSSLKPRILACSIAALVAIGTTQDQAIAASGTWSNVAGGSWPTATNWTGSVIADGVDFVADFSTLNITANATVTLDGARTIGTLRFGDATTASNDWILNTGTAGPLTLDVSTGQAMINVVNRTATINAVLAGTDGVTTLGAGTLVLAGVNTFTGGLTISGATNVQLNNANGAGANSSAISYAAASTGRLVINSGVTIANPINIGAGITSVGGRGLIEPTGTGQGTVGGAITITGAPTNGGHFVGGAAVGNELVLNGPITSSVTVSQREGRVIYRGGGAYTTLTTTGAVIIGANDGLPSGVNLNLTNTTGGSAGSLELGAFNQTLGNLNIVGGSQGTISTGTGVLTLNGSVTSALNFTHVLNGNVDLGGGTRTFTVNNGTNEVDLQAGAAFTNGTITKAGAGTLTLNGISTGTTSVTVNTGTLGGTGTVAGTVTVNTGTVLAPATSLTTGTFSAGTLAFGTGTQNVAMKIGTGGDLISSTTLTTGGGTTTFNLNQLGGVLANGTYPLITYAGTSPGLGGFVLAPLGHATAVLTDTGSAIAATISANDRVIWDGTNSTGWATGATGNWKLQSTLAATDFITGDDVIFQDAPVNSTVDIAAGVTPSNVTFNNTAVTNYTVTGAAGIAGTTGLTKNGNGTTILRTQNSYSGATALNAGTLELDHDATGNAVLTGTSGVSVAAGATLRLTRDDGDITFTRNISGAGTVLIDPHTTAGAAVRNVVISGTNTGFSGLWKLSPSNVGAAGLGSFRTNPQVTATNLGSAAVDADAGGQLWFTGTISNNITITGTGYAEAAGGTPVSVAAATTGGVYLGAGTAPFTYGGTGAIRMEGGILNGNVTLDGTSKIGAVNGTGTINGNISALGASDQLVIGGGTAAHTIIATGAVSVPRILVNGGATTGSQTLQIGNNGTAGSISTPEIILYGSAAANGVLRMNRTDGLTFTNQSIRGGAAVTADLARTFFLVNTTGAGVTLDNSTLDLSDGTTGGTIRVGDTAGITGSILNIAGTSTVDVGFFSLSELAGVSGTVNQSGTSSVSFLTTLRVGHFGTNTSNYNLSGGTISTPTAATATFPYTTGATEQNGGIYVGIDGTGNLTQSGGTITTNFLVLDNRGDTVAGTNMPTGVDTFQQNGGTLVLKSAYGLITRNASTAVNLNGGTIQLAAGVSSALDSNRITVQSGGVTLDTNGANTFTLYGPLAGTGTVTLANTGAGAGVLSVVDGGAGANITAGGTMPGGSIDTPISIASNATLQGNRAVSTTWTGAVSGTGTLTKLNTGSLTLAGSGSGFTGTANASAGRLDVPTNFAATTINIADGASLFGESTNANVNLGTATGGNILFNPNTAGALTATNLTVTGTGNTVDFSTAPSGPGPWTAINYTNLAGGGSIGLANAVAYRVAPVVTTAGGLVTVNVTGIKNETWTGSVGPIWDSGATANTNWNDGVGADNFFAGDSVTFGDGPVQVAVTVTSGVSPWKTTVNSITNNYTLTSTTNGIAGPGNLEKSGASTLTLAGPNTYSGQTVISGGTVASATAATSLGNASVTNTIALSGGGRLSDTGAVALDLGINRAISVGTGGGSISHNNATAATITIPGNLTGSGSNNLSFHSNAAGAGTFVLTGNNTGYTGNISVDAPTVGANGLTTLRIGAQSAAPAGGLITVNYPAAATTSGNAVTLDLPGVSLPAAVGLNMTAFATGALSLRTQVTSSGNSTINGPINLTSSNNVGTTQTPVIQFSVGSGTLTVNGNIAEASPGSFATTPQSVFFARGAGNTVFNGTINLPSALFSRVDNGGTTTINSTGNVWANTDVRSNSTLRLGANNALPITAPLLIGQTTDAEPSVFEMNGFNQELNGLTSAIGTANNARRVTNSSTTLSTLTLNSSTNFTYGNSTGFTGGNITGNVALVKNGTNTQTIAGPANTYTGNVTVNAGTLVAGGGQTSNALGSPTTAGRTVTVNNSGTTLSFTTNNVFGNAVGNANLPSTILNAGTTLTSTRYNVLGALALNGATVSGLHGTNDAANYQSWQLKGNVTVGGTSASTISGSGSFPGVHLDTASVFTVADATSSNAADLVVSVPLINQSGDFSGATGGLTKDGAGTMEISSASTYTGPTNINAGSLLVSGAINGSSVAVNNGGTLAGGGLTGPVSVASGGTLAPGIPLGTGALSLAGGSTFSLELGATTGSQANSSGAVTLAGNIALTLTLTANPVDGTAFTIINSTGVSGYTGGARFVFGANSLDDGEQFTAANGSFSQLFQIDYDAAGGTQVQLLAVVPEPGTLVSLLGGLGVLCGFQRFHRRKN